ncbi:MAG TPA: pyridoxamine 5'-phosphate oxidase family protein, partial [Mycobacteriales bacterium]|nr:pyridoxamine 5'-phosphate oxidase family protein [Mycobacteriales bacterium]
MLNDAARALIESGALAHMVTIDEDGAPQVAVVWVGIDGDELVAGHLDGNQRKLRNLRRDPRVAISFEADTDNGIGMRH